jgi:gliding motility-associated-like protein
LFTASGSLPGTYSWSSGQNTQAFTENIAATNNYIVTYTYGDGCTKTDNVLVTVNGESVPLDLPSPTQICPGDGITLNNESVPIGATYVWTAAPPDPTLGTSAGNPTVSPAGTTTYTVVATLGICVSTRTVTIGVAQGTLNPTQDTVICSGDMITLNANASPGTLLWSTGDTSPSILVSPTNTTTYNVALTYGNNCVLTESVKVTVIPSFELNIVSDPSNDTLNLGQTLELAASITPGGNIQQYTFEWLQNGTENIGTQQLITTTISTDDNTIRYVLVATSPGGCVREASALFTVIQPVVDVPNAFTPGNDTLNNTFKLIFIEGSGIIENMQIYNRWGQKIFTSTEAIKEWDGTAGGKPAPMDTYIYRISWRRLDGELQAPITGEVTLIR